MARSTLITELEKRHILILLGQGQSVAAVAKSMGRTRQAIYQLRNRMEARGELDQLVLPLGSKGRADADD